MDSKIGSRESILSAWFDDIHIYIYIYIYKTTLKIYLYSWIQILIHTVHSCKYIQEKDISRGQRFLWTINSNRTFTDTNPEIKKNHNPIKIIHTIRLPKPLLDS